MTKHTTYQDAGVDITAGNNLVQNIKQHARATYRSEVISGIGGFSGLFSLEKTQIKNPVLVASTDGIGTKLKLALDYGFIDHLGQDLVAMCVNDLICTGAEPLFFLDYFATSSLDLKQAGTLIQNMASCLQDINCTLLGGETAEMPGLYKPNDFDVAGFAVGIVDRTKIISSDNVQMGDIVLALPSSGFHSNGYSLVRRIISQAKLDLSQIPSYLSQSLGHELLTPTTIYVNPILDTLKKHTIHAMAHNTGGGIVENLPRVLPQFSQATIEKTKINTPQIFRFLQEAGHVPEDEMWRVFNMGIGFFVIVPKNEESDILNTLKTHDIAAYPIGVIEAQKDAENACIKFV